MRYCTKAKAALHLRIQQYINRPTVHAHKFNCGPSRKSSSVCRSATECGRRSFLPLHTLTRHCNHCSVQYTFLPLHYTLSSSSACVCVCVALPLPLAFSEASAAAAAAAAAMTRDTHSFTRASFPPIFQVQVCHLNGLTRTVRCYFRS